MSSRLVRDLMRECQLFAGQSIFAESPKSRKLLVDQFVSRLRHPELAAEKLIFSSMLLNVALRWGLQVHRQYHTHYPGTCSFDPGGDMLRHWQDRETSPISSFSEWARSFLDAFDRTHGVPPAVRLKEIIDGRDDSPLRLESLGRMVGCHPVRLRLMFRREFGISIREYQTRCRILQAARLLAMSEDKIDPVAHTVGFRSRKNFYKAFHRIVGATPSAVRAWSLSDLEYLECGVSPRSKRSEEC